MSDIVIKVEGLSKQYYINESRTRYMTLRDSLSEFVKSPFHRLFASSRNTVSPSHHDAASPILRSSDSTIWALKDVSFCVKRGEIVGIIGRNGAGKTTLLKILARITKPTAGYAEIHGRVGCLLGISTGFHPELTGRENIYFSGAVLGMKKAEITQKFDAIVSFAELEKFIDTPVKRYSSGMYVRLGFAISVHLDPGILLIDEVLAVGDTAFQKKCLGKMDEIAKEGRTILFVSHKMSAVEHLCQRTLVLKEGALSFDGPTNGAVELYLSQLNLVTSLSFDNPEPDPVKPFEVTKIDILDKSEQVKSILRSGDCVRFRITWRSSEVVKNGGVRLGILTLNDVPLIRYSTRLTTNTDTDSALQFQQGINTVELEFKQFPLPTGRYKISVVLFRQGRGRLYRNTQFAIFPVEAKASSMFQSGKSLKASRSLLSVPHKWIFPNP